jgi:ketosteroid isomerase-like protein
MIAVLFSLFSLSLAFGHYSSQKMADDSAVVGLEQAWNQAELHHDVKATNLFLADSFIYVDNQGQLQNKAQYLAGIEDTSYSPQEIRNEDLKVIMYGDTAIATSAYMARGTEQGKTFAFHGRFVDVWVKLNGIWLCVSDQETEIAR